MIDEQKQIEEMAKVMSENWFNETIVECATRLYKANYRKIPENTVVLDQEVYKELKFAADHYDPFWFCTFGGCEGACKECKDTCELSIFVQVRKEMAREIVEKLKAKAVENGNKNPIIGERVSKRDIDELAKQYGMEVEE